MTSTGRPWQEIELGQIAEFRNGVNYTKENFGRGVRVINVKDFQDYSTPRYDELDEINPEGVVRDAHLLQENDVIFVRSNGNRELIGRSMMLLSVPPVPVTHSAFTIRARLSDSPEVKRGGSTTEIVRLIDWRNPEANDFYLASQFWVRGEMYRRRPDVVGFVNGIPLLLCEFKKSSLPVRSAYDDTRWTATAPSPGCPVGQTPGRT